MSCTRRATNMNALYTQCTNDGNATHTNGLHANEAATIAAATAAAIVVVATNSLHCITRSIRMAF